MDKALAFITLQKEALEASGKEECRFIITNKTHQLVTYDQAVFFAGSADQMRADSVSGNAVIEPKGTLTHIIETIIQTKIKPEKNSTERAILPLDNEADIPAEYKEAWKDYASPHNALMVLSTVEEGILGALLIQRSKAFDEAELAILDELASGYSKALALQQLRQNKGFSLFFAGSSRYKKWSLILLLILFFIPVRLSITAPAEIVAEESKIVSAPFPGLIDDILIKPGSAVKQGDILAIMDQDTLKSDAQSAEQALELAQISLARVRRESITAPEKKSELNELQAEIKARKIEYDYAKTLLERSEIKAPQDGIAIFADQNALEGKPVQTGEPLMTIASTANKELLVRVPVDAMLDINDDAPVSFYSNISPLFSHQGRITSAGYQASADADGLMTYKIRARIDESDNLRVGWKGTAKIYDEWSILGYAVLRRPLIALRNIIGF